jgi:OmcA/MtrC family decaheme c-type cytochrome
VEPDPINLEILAVTIPEGPNPRPVIRFRVTDAAGAPINFRPEVENWNLGVPTAANRQFPHTIARFTLAQLDQFGNYTSYYTVNRNAAAYTVPEGQTAPPTQSPATQATTQPTTTTGWPVADLVDAGPGTYDLTLGPANVPNLDRTRTHTAAGWVVRTRTALDSDVDAASFNFVPSGGAAVERDEAVSDAACNRCHGVLQAHGTRRDVQFCITCHSPQTTDPETSRTVDFQVMIHKIHQGGNLPSVQKGTNYFIVGNQQSVHDYSDVAFPWHDGVQHCTVCHAGGEDSDNWRARPSITACTSCHDNVKFAAGEAPTSCSLIPPAQRLDDCVHTGGPIAVANPDDPAACLSCHGPGESLAVDRYHHGD